ncbi:hypothetical protein R1flu_014903 [Riccia fluitans]|uniref:Uncharacterized protein n=1 Tax=Riccia fluitans TaxID=41844 RepID=A0ABD1YL73_9MARC
MKVQRGLLSFILQHNFISAQQKQHFSVNGFSRMSVCASAVISFSGICSAISRIDLKNVTNAGGAPCCLTPALYFISEFCVEAFRKKRNQHDLLGQIL